MGGYWQKFLGWSSATTRSALRVASHTTNLGHWNRGLGGCQLPLPPKIAKLQGQSMKNEVEEPKTGSLQYVHWMPNQVGSMEFRGSVYSSSTLFFLGSVIANWVFST